MAQAQDDIAPWKEKLFRCVVLTQRLPGPA